MNNKDYEPKDHIIVDDIEKIKAEYFDKDVLPVTSYKIYRTDFHGLRNYIKAEEVKGKEGFKLKLSVAPSQTTVGKRAPESYFLTDWKIKQGNWEKINFMSGGAADYGTFFHVIIQRIINGEKITFDRLWLESYLVEFLKAESLDYERCLKWYRQEKRDLRKDLYGWFKWLKDFDVKPIACEIPVFVDFENNPHEKRDEYDIGQYATVIDFVCKLTLPATKKKEAEVVTVIVDWKSRLTGNFYENEQIQLHACKVAWEKNFPDHKIDKLYNWCPANFRIPVGVRSKLYTFKDQTDTSDKLTAFWNSYLFQYHSDPKNFEFDKRYDFKSVKIGIDDSVDDIFESVDILSYLQDDKEAF